MLAIRIMGNRPALLLYCMKSCNRRTNHLVHIAPIFAVEYRHISPFLIVCDKLFFSYCGLFFLMYWQHPYFNIPVSTYRMEITTLVYEVSF